MKHKIIISILMALIMGCLHSAEVADGGTQAVADAQASAGAPAGKKFKDATKVLKDAMNAKGWLEGWDENEGAKRAIVVESAEFITKDPANDSAFFIKREMAAKKAVLIAKVAIVESINQNMSAYDMLDTPATDVFKQLNDEREQINAQLERQKEALAKLLEPHNEAEAKSLRGADVKDKFIDLMNATIKKMDSKYDKNEKDAQYKEAFATAKANYLATEKEYNALLAKAEEIQMEVKSRQESMVETMANMPLFGTSVIMQTESWDDASGRYVVAVMLCWSSALEESARAIATGAEINQSANPKGKTVQEWIASQNPAVMVGPRQFTDKNGDKWFIGITARAYDDNMNSSAREKNKSVAELYAQQMAVFSIFADIESYKQAKTATERRENAKGEESDVVAESYATKLSQSFSNKKVRGLQKLFEDEVVHPITGRNIIVAVYGINSKFAKIALEVERQNYATAVLANHHQTVEKGRDAANKAAVEASKNRPEDYKKGYSESEAGIANEVNKAESQNNANAGINIINDASDDKSTPADAPKSTSGSFGGDVDVADDF